MITNKGKCPCYDLEPPPPRWDIYACDYCGRKLASFDDDKIIRESLWLRLAKSIKRIFGK